MTDGQFMAVIKRQKKRHTRAHGNSSMSMHTRHPIQCTNIKSTSLVRTRLGLKPQGGNRRQTTASQPFHGQNQCIFGSGEHIRLCLFMSRFWRSLNGEPGYKTVVLLLENPGVGGSGEERKKEFNISSPCVHSIHTDTDTKIKPTKN